MGELIRLTKENMNKLSSSRVCLISCAQNYLFEMKKELGPKFVDDFERYAKVEDISAFEPDFNYVIADDYYKEIYDKLAGKIASHAVVYFYANKETAYDLNYREKYKDEPLRDIIVFRSGPHASAYIKGLPRASEYRERFHKLETLQEMVDLVNSYGNFLQNGR